MSADPQAGWCQSQVALAGTGARNLQLWYPGTGTPSAASSAGSQQHSLAEADRVAQIIKEDLWPNPPCSTTCSGIGPTEPGKA